ncbi:uncharacterized protein LOC128998984 [Macrosteles quadrilineatus]|uniref:uncharacterized protein LOC128998984 n=1 Tax=Macrosteles quadrilineatus TaxID=74068 RepID=UPI0023E0D9C0|nr:uncharacterized protein LOC128998984 [Macrosteles quadrilineatus]
MCRRCRAYFYNTPNKKAEEQLKRHTEFCQGISGGPLFNDTPKGNKTKLYFRNFENLRKKRFTIYLDFESLTTPVKEPGSSNTVVLQKHVPFSFGYLLKDEESDMLTNYRAYCGLDAPSKLFNMLKEDIEKIEKVLYTKRIRDVPELTDQQQHEFDLATTCHICLRGGFDDRNKKVRSHDHVSGRFYGAAHNRCNLFYRDQRVVNVVVHNLSRYDANFIIPELGKQDGKITVIPHTTDTFISFTKKMGGMTVQFIDSYRFLSFSLDKLSSFLSDNKKALSRKYFPEDETFNLITTKGFLPYDYLSSLSKLEETSLPPMESFYSILTDEDINPQNYEQAKSIWRVFECKTLKDYVMIYQMCDILLLADVFEDFRSMSMREFQLDPLYYVSTPGLTFDAMLRYTNVTIDLLTDLEMVKFVQRGMRGGLVGCSHRLSRANNPYMEHLYDPTKPTSYLWYIDANNLYGFCLSKHLPISEFTWVEGNDDLVKEVLQLPPDSDTGYFLEADFQYPDHLHDTHNDMPFLPEVQVIDGQNMLMETLGSRTKYVCHYRALQQAVEHGLILTKIHRGIKFKQSPYIAPYVELTTKKRIESGNPFEEEFWKLMNNALYEFVGLRSKEYATKKFDVKKKIEETNKKKSKGTQKRVVQKEVDFEDYKDSLFNTRPKEEKTKTGLCATTEDFGLRTSDSTPGQSRVRLQASTKDIKAGTSISEHLRSPDDPSPRRVAEQSSSLRSITAQSIRQRQSVAVPTPDRLRLRFNF